MKRSDLEMLLRGIGPVLKEKFTALEQRIAELEASRTEFKGLWNAGVPYRRGDLVTRSGALWCCRVDATSAVPGTDPATWQMAAKGGDR